MADIYISILLPEETGLRLLYLLLYPFVEYYLRKALSDY